MDKKDAEYGGRLWPESTATAPRAVSRGSHRKAAGWAAAAVCLSVVAASVALIGPKVLSSAEATTASAPPKSHAQAVEADGVTLRLERVPFPIKPRPDGCPAWFPAATLEFRGVVVKGTIYGGYHCGGLFADTFFYGFERKARLLPIPDGTELRIEGSAALKSLTLDPISGSASKRLETQGALSALTGTQGGYTMEANIAWEHSSVMFDFPVAVVEADSPVPLASVRLPGSGSAATLSFEGQELAGISTPAQRSHGDIVVTPLAKAGETIRLPRSAEIWVNADPSDASAAWAVTGGSGYSRIERVDFDYYDAMGLDLSALEPGSYQLLIGVRRAGEIAGYAFGIEVTDDA